ncbi:hypothetical protein EGT07_26060 [Herbaspirillum sp. HC18]|nr:hypothetical protein EGT07_26060 [Herbaspirillum sp. HC18]
MKKSLSIGLFVAVFTLDVLAGPAPWYLWKSKIDGNAVCAQTSPGDGWRKAAGPFKDAHCKTPA